MSQLSAMLFFMFGTCEARGCKDQLSGCLQDVLHMAEQVPWRACSAGAMDICSLLTWKRDSGTCQTATPKTPQKVKSIVLLASFHQSFTMPNREQLPPTASGGLRSRRRFAGSWSSAMRSAVRCPSTRPALAGGVS